MPMQVGFSRWFPQRCAICAVDVAAPLVCAACLEDFFSVRRNRCLCCAIPLPGSASTCPACLRQPPHYDVTIALADYAAPVDGLVLALKFGHQLELAPILGSLLAERARHLAPCPLLLAVPLAFERLAERGFNQSAEIGRAVARALRAKFDLSILMRVRHAAAQASLSLAARRRNIRDAFLVRGDVRGQSVAVIDDVMTSGSTLDEIARVLKIAGATHVTNLVVARTP